MKIVSLGSGGFHPSELRHTACFMLPVEGILLDAGTPVFRVPKYLATDYLDILVSHAHLDHIVGLTYLLAFRDVVPNMTAYMSAETAAAVREHLFSPPLFPVEPPFTIVELEEDATHELQSGCRITSFPLHHPGGCRGYRLDWQDRSMAYVTDTTANPKSDYVAKIKGVDLLVHECYFPDGREAMAAKTGHSCATPVAEVAKAADVGQMLIVHVDPASASEDPVGLAGMRAIFPHIQLGVDLLELDF